MSKKSYDDWTVVKGLKPVKVIGSADRFSISIPVSDEWTVGINGCRILKGCNGKFISFPAWKHEKTGKYHDYAFANFGKDNEKIIEMFD